MVGSLSFSNSFSEKGRTSTDETWNGPADAISDKRQQKEIKGLNYAVSVKLPGHSKQYITGYFERVAPRFSYELEAAKLYSVRSVAAKALGQLNFVRWLSEHPEAIVAIEEIEA